MIDLNNFVSEIESVGLLDVALPLFLIFSIVYAVLSKVKVFEKNANIAVAFVMGLVTVIFHVLGMYPPCWDVVDIMNNAFPKIGLTLLIILIFMFVVGVIGLNISLAGRYLGWVAIAGIIFVAYIFLTSGGSGCGLDYYGGFAWGDIGFPVWIVPIAIFAVLVWWITRKGGGSNDRDIY